MATINKHIIKPKKVEWKREEIDSTNYYGSVAWQRLRNIYIREHPVCEECLKHGHVTDAEEVHHLLPYMSEKTEEARWNTFLNPKNLRALCKSCHYAYHYKMRHNRLRSVSELSDEEWTQSKFMYSN